MDYPLVFQALTKPPINAEGCSGGLNVEVCLPTKSQFPKHLK
jgi:hypothetical protein